MARILITVPTWNEAGIIAQNLRTLHASCQERLNEHDWLIEVADNGSQDQTRQIVETLRHELDRLTLRAIETRGKGGAIRNSWLAGEDLFDAFVFLDADLAADIRALPALVEPILSGQADLVCGSRFTVGLLIKRSPCRRSLSFAYRMWQKKVLHLPTEDAQCGFKAVSPRVVHELLPFVQERGWLFDTELLALVAERGLMTQPLPVDWIDQRHANRRSALSVWRDGWDFIFGVWRIRRRIMKDKM